MVVTSSLLMNGMALLNRLNINNHILVPKGGCASKVKYLMVNLTSNFDGQLGLESTGLNMRSCFSFIRNLYHNDFYITNLKSSQEWIKCYGI